MRIYIDALWVFLVLSYSLSAGFTFLVNPAGRFAKRRIVVWFNSTRAELFPHVKPLQIGWNGLMWAVKTVFGGAGVPLMWLAVVGIVYGVSTRADWHAAARRTVGERGAAFIEKVVPSARLRLSWVVVPTPLRGKVSDYALSKTGQYQPVVDWARLILHGGPVALATYVLAYLGLAWLDTAGSFYSASSDHGYLFRGMAWLIGPQRRDVLAFVHAYPRAGLTADRGAAANRLGCHCFRILLVAREPRPADRARRGQTA